MMRNSIELGDRIFVKGYGFWSFPRIMSRNIDKNLEWKI